jgi:twitching motility protein PilT
LELNEILRAAAKHGASDVHLKVGLPPVFRINGKLVPLKVPEPLKPGDLEAMTEIVFQEGQKERFERRHELDCAYGVPGLGRFRVNVFQQRGTIGIVMRLVPVGVRTFDDLHLPKVMEKIALEERGLILCTGTTGCGKSTTLAAMVQYINTHRSCHVMTIEDPIEFLLRDGKSIINQRELGVDTSSFADALKSALRQDPDVILVGEMRDLETIETAIVAAETGHLVLSTLHTMDAAETINRIVASFPPFQQKQIRLQLASVLKAVISQRLLPRADGQGRRGNPVEHRPGPGIHRRQGQDPQDPRGDRAGIRELRNADLRPVPPDAPQGGVGHPRRGPPASQQPRRLRLAGPWGLLDLGPHVGRF